MDGTLFTNNARAHGQEGVSDRCPWCGAADGNYHRAWECPGFADCRASVPDWILRYVTSLPSSFSAHAWPPLPSAWLSHGRTLASLSDGLVKTVGGVIDGAGSCDLFTDGACLLPHEPPLRLAAWAVTIGRLDWNTLDHHVLAAGPLPGLQKTAFRAELYAVAVALEWASTQACEMRIWSDCQAVVDGVRRVQAGLYHFQANGSHADLWLRVSKALKRVTSKVTILKVAAHQTIVADLPLWRHGPFGRTSWLMRLHGKRTCSALTNSGMGGSNWPFSSLKHGRFIRQWCRFTFELARRPLVPPTRQMLVLVA